MRITMIRHGMTLGNTQKRYIGVTDERLCPEGIQTLETGVAKGYYPAADTIYVSPLKRCIETDPGSGPEQAEQAPRGHLCGGIPGNQFRNL